MTDQAPPPHLDDEDLSALLDGEAADGDASAAHLAGCTVCAGRREALATARDALRGAGVAPLPTTVLDRLVAAALDAPAEAETPAPAGVVPLGRARTRRLTSPPPAWLLGAVASIAVLAGLAGLLRSGGGSDDAGLDVASQLRGEPESEAGVAAEESAQNGDHTASDAAASVDPELVTADLGEIAGADELTAALDAPTAHAFSAGRTAAAGSADASEGASGVATTAPAPGAGGTAAAGAPPPDRAQCLVEAERAGGTRLGTLQATATLRWEGRPAEVLVFVLAEPGEPVSRRARVLARPGCDLLADLPL